MAFALFKFTENRLWHSNNVAEYRDFTTNWSNRSTRPSPLLNVNLAFQTPTPKSKASPNKPHVPNNINEVAYLLRSLSQSVVKLQDGLSSSEQNPLSSVCNDIEDSILQVGKTCNFANTDNLDDFIECTTKLSIKHEKKSGANESNAKLFMSTDDIREKLGNFIDRSEGQLVLTSLTKTMLKKALPWNGAYTNITTKMLKDEFVALDTPYFMTAYNLYHENDVDKTPDWVRRLVDTIKGEWGGIGCNLAHWKGKTPPKSLKTIVFFPLSSIHAEMCNDKGLVDTSAGEKQQRR